MKAEQIKLCLANMRQRSVVPWARYAWGWLILFIWIGWIGAAWRVIEGYTAKEDARVVWMLVAMGATLFLALCVWSVVRVVIDACECIIRSRIETLEIDDPIERRPLFPSPEEFGVPKT